MVRFEKDKIVIEIETDYPESDWLNLYEDLLRAIGAANKDLVDSKDDYIYSLCDFLTHLLPDELWLRDKLKK